MPARRRRRKSRKRKAPSRRKPAPSRRSRPASGSPLSSDYEVSLASLGDEDETEEEEDSDEDEDEKEEDESDEGLGSVASRQPASPQPPRRRRRRRPRRSASSDEDFVLDDSDDDDDASAGNGHANALPPAPALRNYARNVVSIRDFDADVVQHADPRHAPRRARAQRRKCRKQDSSDEDFEISDSQNGGSVQESPVAAVRPVTRAMEGGHGSHAEGVFSVQLEIRNAKEDLGVAQKFNSEAGVSSVSKSSSARKKVRISEKGTVSSTRKGKEKVLEGEVTVANSLTEKVDVLTVEGGAAAAVVCGICLSETVLVDRGKLDCCDHFFCFGCIMEWAKVESRCPMCKQRFATVSKTGSGVSKRTRTIRIPLRDQVYIPPEEDLPFEDPYADVACMECLGTGDEGLLLLCDRCDSAAHTFCVGLGRSVPRGDWYCRDCQALAGEDSDSENEAEELVLASDSEEEDEETVLTSIVSSENRPRRQRRVRQVASSMPAPSSQPRRTFQQGGRRGLWRRFVLNRGRRRRAPTTPQLSQSARAYLASVTPEQNQISCPLEAPHSGSSARTVPQQRRLQERIVAIRNNWGRLQNGDVQFDAIRNETTASGHPRLSSIGSSAPVAAPVLSESDKAEVDCAETSLPGNTELERAWRMMGRARNLCPGTPIGGVQHQKPVLSHHATASSVRHGEGFQLTDLHIDRTKRSSPVARRNVDIVDAHTDVTSSWTSARGDAGSNVEPKESLEMLLRRAKGLSRSPVYTAKYVEEMKQNTSSYSSDTANADNGVSSSGTLEFSRVKSAVDSSVDACNHRERTHQTGLMNRGIVNSNMHSFDRTNNCKEQGVDKEGVSAKDVNGTKASFSPHTEGLKIHLTELVKKQTWPVYLAERLDKEQFKRIARAAVHSLLALFDTNNNSRSFSCSHHEEQSKNPLVPCCTKCLDQHVEIAVTTAKDKVVPR